MNKKVHLYSAYNPSQDFYNFGDALGVQLVARLSNLDVEVTPFWKSNMLGPGSVLFSGDELFLKPIPISFAGMCRAARERLRRALYPSLKIWGSGFIRPPEIISGEFSKEFDICAVRGVRTLEILERMHVVKDPSLVTLGDPGLLYPMLLEEMPPRSFEIGVIPHYVDKIVGRNMYNKLLSLGVKVLLIDVNDKDSVGVLRQIASCKTIISSSLHGCIVSDAMGIPNKLMQLSMISAKPSPSYLDYSFKFLDYYSIYGITDIKPIEINEFYDNPNGIVGRIKGAYSIDHTKVESIKRNLLSSFPYGMAE